MRESVEVSWNSGHIRVEPSLKKRTCHKCGSKIPKGTFSMKVRMGNYHASLNNNICMGCLREVTSIVKFMNNEGEDIRYDRVRESV